MIRLKKEPEKEFWVTNISNRRVSLADLDLTIPPFTTVNLLSKHYYYTEEELEKSVSSGSIYAKRDKIRRRETAPDVDRNDVAINIDAIIPERATSIYEIKIENNEELDISDEEYAAENADMAEIDAQPLIKK